MTRPFQPSPQQAAIFSWVQHGRGSARVDAVAGAGKTTTLVHAVELMQGSVALCAFNKRIADEIKARIGTRPRVSVGTFHSFGFNAWRKTAPQVRVEDKKVEHLCDTLDVPLRLRSFVKQLTSLGKQTLIGVTTPRTDRDAWMELVQHFDLEEKLSEDGLIAEHIPDLVEQGIQYTINVLRLGVEQNQYVIDFDDMLYAPLVHNVRMWKNDWVLVDEAQDTNPARRMLAQHMLAGGGRLIAVGDPHQAIYGFTGADNDAMDLITKEFRCTALPLTVTYRCPRAVVVHTRQWVQHIEAHPGAPEGVVRSLDAEAFLELPVDAFQRTDAVLCRNTKPLVELAYALIRRQIACHVEGRDIGAGLLALANKWKAVRTLDKLRDKLAEYLFKQRERLKTAGREIQVAALEDRVETLYVMIDAQPPGATLDALRLAVQQLFGDTQPGEVPDTLTLSTIHKAKGREWGRVYWYGRNKYQPSAYARQPWQMDQEVNLMYVAATRAKAELIEIIVAEKAKKRSVPAAVAAGV